MNQTLQLIQDYLEQHNIKTRYIHRFKYLCVGHIAIYTSSLNNTIVVQYETTHYPNTLSTLHSTCTEFDMTDPNSLQLLLQLLREVLNQHEQNPQPDCVKISVTKPIDSQIWIMSYN